MSRRSRLLGTGFISLVGWYRLLGVGVAWRGGGYIDEFSEVLWICAGLLWWWECVCCGGSFGSLRASFGSLRASFGGFQGLFFGFCHDGAGETFSKDFVVV